MAYEDTLMRKSLKKILVPALKETGFNGKGWNFQRSSGSLDLLSVQFWKYGGQFILEAARQPRGDFHTSWGEVVPEAQVTVAHISPHKRARLEQLDTAAAFSWFTFQDFGDDQSRYDALARQVIELLPQLEHWLDTNEAGTHVRPLVGPRNHDAG
jgi:hypothetical protein